MITVRSLTEQDRELVNTLATHPLQSYEWGEFRKATGVVVVRKGLFDGKTCLGVFQMTVHPVPHAPFTIGYIPKGTMPTEDMLGLIAQTAKEYRCIFVQIEPDVVMNESDDRRLLFQKTVPLCRSAHPLFTKYTLQLDLTKSEEELLRHMHPKTRYNMRLAQKHGVIVTQEHTKEAFDIYWDLTRETTTRQKFYAHTGKYHQTMWKILGQNRIDGLSAHLFVAWYTPLQEKKRVPLVAWVLFTFHDKLYYPYGASSARYKNVMASNLMMWEAILFGKKKGLKIFDMWGSLSKDPDIHDPWYGFHRLKMGYGPKHVEFLGSYDLILQKPLYILYVFFDKLRWFLLKIKK